MTNPYNTIFTDSSTDIALSYNKAFRSIDRMYELSKEVSIAFMLCHVSMGLQCTKRIFNETLVGLLSEHGNSCNVNNLDVVDVHTYHLLAEAISLNLSRQICMELIDELESTKEVNKFIHFLKPKYSKAIL